MITVGFMAKTYGLLPSEVLANATTFDVMVTDVYTTWEQHEMDKAQGKPPTTDQFDQDELKKMMERTKNGGRD